jgi:hypothetical protein
VVEGEEDGEWWNYDDEEGTEPPTGTDLARADELERRLEELRARSASLQPVPDTVVDGKPAVPLVCHHAFTTTSRRSSAARTPIPRATGTTVKTAYRKPLR